MERIPAANATVPVAHQYDFPTCEFHSFPVDNISLLPNIRLIDCKVAHDLAPEEVEFEFTHKGGELFGKQTGKRIEEVNLETNEYGVNYFLNYAPIRGVQESLGRWCCWVEGKPIEIVDLKENEDSTGNMTLFIPHPIPTRKELLPNELHEVHIQSDGGMVYRASWNIGQSPRGLAIILCGLGGMQYSSTKLGRALLKDDWAVAYLYTVLNIPEYSMEVQLNGNDPTTSALDIFESKYCEVINATKAVLARMESQLPSLQHAPLALIVISAGALNAPAVYNELQEEIDAVVLIAGGANMFNIVQDGAFTNWKFVGENDKRFSKYELEKMNETYLQTPSRDPYFLAPLLPKDNTLIIHAKWDTVVPSENGDLLYERAGKPERWVYPSGHLGLFATFGWHSDDIADWLQTKLEN